MQILTKTIMENSNNQNMYNPSVSTGVQTTFFGKVMGFFALAIAASALGVYVSNQYLTEFLFTNSWSLYVVWGLELVLIFTSRSWSTKTPLNRVLFFAFAFLTGISLSPILLYASLVAGPAIITKALAATALSFVAAAVLGHTTSMDLSKLRGFLFIGLIGLIIVGILGIFFPWNNDFELVFSGFGVLLFTGYTMYDFQKIKNYPENRYVDAALRIYLDIFNLFIFILRLLIALNGRD